MKTIRFALLILVVAAGSAVAQPGQTAPDPYPPPPAQPYPDPQPQPYPQPYQPPPQQQPPAGYQVPPPYAYQPQVQLTAEEMALLQRGEISDGQHIGGGVVALFFGFGIGQAVQGRWSDTGWIFTLGESASFVALMAGIVKTFNNCDFAPIDGTTSCTNHDGDTLLAAGLIGILVFRTWELVDAFAGPPKHNNRVRELRMRLGMPQQQMYGHRITPYMNKSRDGGGVAGVSIRF